MAFCGNRQSVNTWSNYQTFKAAHAPPPKSVSFAPPPKGKDSRDPKQNGSGKGPEIKPIPKNESIQYVDTLLQYYAKYYVSIEKEIGLAANIPWKQFKCDPQSIEMPIVHRSYMEEKVEGSDKPYIDDLYSLFRGFKHAEVLDLVYGHEIVDVYYPQITKEDFKKIKDDLGSKQLDYTKIDFAEKSDYIPPLDEFDVPIIAANLTDPKIDKVNVGFHDEVLTRKYARYLRKTLFNLSIKVEVLVVNLKIKKDHPHNGYHMFVYGFIQSLLIAGMPLFVPGFNVRELVRRFVGYELYTAINNKGWYNQWYQCILKDLIKQGMSEYKTDLERNEVCDMANTLIQTYVLDKYDDDKVMLLAFCFTPYLCSHYNPAKDYCIISQPMYNYLASTTVKEMKDVIIYDHNPIGDIYGVMTPNCNIYSVHMKNNKRVYYDFIPRSFLKKLKQQSMYTVEASNVMIFYPAMTIYTIHDGKNLPLVKGLDNISAYSGSFVKHSFPKELCFVDELSRTFYFAKGDYTSCCYERAIIDSFLSKGVDMKAQFDADIINMLAHCDQACPEFYAAQNGQNIVINTNVGMLPNFDNVGALPAVIPDGITPMAMILLFDLTFGTLHRRDRFKEQVLKIHNWRALYHGNQQFNNDAQLLDAIANQYNIQNVISPYSNYTLEYFITNVRQYRDDNGDRVPEWDQLSTKYVYPGLLNDERHTIRILQINNLEDNTCHAYSLYHGGTDDRNDFLLFMLRDQDVSYILHHYPWVGTSSVGVRVSKMMQRGLVGHQIPVFNPRERGGNGMVQFDPVIANVNAFARNLDAGSNYIQLPDTVSRELGLYYYDNNNVQHYCHFLFCSHIFIQKAFQYLGDEFAIAQPDSLYIRLLLGEQIPFIDAHYIKIDNRLVNKKIINPTPYCLSMTKWKGPNNMEKPFYARVKDWYVYEVRCKDDDEPTLSDHIEKSTLTPLFVDNRIVKSYDLYGVAKRPIQAFYRDVVKCISENYASHSLSDSSIYQSETLISNTLIYLEKLRGMDRIHVDGNVCGVASGLCFDKRMKSIPFINAPLVKLNSDGNIMKYIYYYYAFLGPSHLMGNAVYAYFNNTCPENVTEAVCARQLMYRPGAVYHENVYHAFDMFYKHFADYFEDAVQLTASELLRVHKNGRKYMKSYCSEDSIIFLVFSAFIKTEPYPFDYITHKIKPPRLIMNPGKLVNFFMITFSHMLEECLKRIPYFAKGKNSRETGEDLWNLWSRLRNPCAIGMDFTQFEHFVSTSVLVASMSIFVHLTGMPERYIRKWVRRLVYLCKMYKLDFLATRISGEFQTSFGNMIIVGAILYFVIQNVKSRHPGSQAYFYSAGDDCMILCNIDEQDWYKEEMSRIVRDFGMIVKTEAVYTEFDKIHFCQQYPVYVKWTDENGQTKNVWWMVNDIVRVLDKLSVQPHVPKMTKSDLNRWACLGCYIEFMFGSLPELKDLIYNLKSLAPYKFHGTARPDFRRAFKTSQDWHIIEALGSSHNFKPEYIIINPLRFYRVCGMEEWVMKFYSTYFRDWSPYDYIHHNVDVEFHVEKDGSTTFQYGAFSVVKCIHKYNDTDLGDPRLRAEDPSYTQLEERWFHKMLNVCGGYTM